MILPFLGHLSLSFYLNSKCDNLSMRTDTLIHAIILCSVQ